MCTFRHSRNGLWGDRQMMIQGLLTIYDLTKQGRGRPEAIDRQRRAGIFPAPDFTDLDRWMPETIEQHEQHIAASNKRIQQDSQSGQKNLFPDEPPF